MYLVFPSIPNLAFSKWNLRFISGRCIRLSTYHACMYLCVNTHVYVWVHLIERIVEGGSRGDFTPIAIYTPERECDLSWLPQHPILARPIWNCLSLCVYIYMHIYTNREGVQKCFTITTFRPRLNLLTHPVPISSLYRVILLSYNTHFISFRSLESNATQREIL